MSDDLITPEVVETALIAAGFYPDHTMERRMRAALSAVLPALLKAAVERERTRALADARRACVDVRSRVTSVLGDVACGQCVDAIKELQEITAP